MRFINRLKQPFVFLVFLLSMVMPAKAVVSRPNEKTAYDFSFEALDGSELPLSAYRGKVLMVVNTASKCGFTPQYKALETLYERYKERGLVIIGVPSNDFGGQEPGNAEQIKQFCTLNYGVTFPMAAKQPVSGDEAHPFYRWAREVLGWSAAPKWNFHKYMIDRQGKPVDYFVSTTAPDSEKVTEILEKLLAE